MSKKHHSYQHSTSPAMSILGGLMTAVTGRYRQQYPNRSPKIRAQDGSASENFTLVSYYDQNEHSIRDLSGTVELCYGEVRCAGWSGATRCFSRT